MIGIRRHGDIFSKELEDMLRKERVLTKASKNRRAMLSWLKVKPFQCKTLSASFNWSVAPEGREFWVKLHKKQQYRN